MIQVWFRQGVLWDLISEAHEGFRQVVKAAKEDIYVTSGRDGQHLPHSFHYTGRAWDMSKSGFTKTRLLKILNGINPKHRWQVIDHGTWFHIELDNMEGE